jgi:hypothetical protein
VARRKTLPWRTIKMARRKRRPYMEDPGYAQKAKTRIARPDSAALDARPPDIGASLSL